MIETMLIRCWRITWRRQWWTFWWCSSVHHSLIKVLLCRYFVTAASSFCRALYPQFVMVKYCYVTQPLVLKHWRDVNTPIPTREIILRPMLCCYTARCIREGVFLPYIGFLIPVSCICSHLQLMRLNCCQICWCLCVIDFVNSRFHVVLLYFLVLASKSWHKGSSAISVRGFQWWLKKGGCKAYCQCQCFVFFAVLGHWWLVAGRTSRP